VAKAREAAETRAAEARRAYGLALKQLLAERAAGTRLPPARPLARGMLRSLAAPEADASDEQDPSGPLRVWGWSAACPTPSLPRLCDIGCFTPLSLASLGVGTAERYQVIAIAESNRPAHARRASASA
jgi:hypothetical protein